MRSLAPLVALLLAAPAVAEGPPLETAREPIERLYQALEGAMQGGESLGISGRRELIRPAVDAAYDIGFMGSKALGRHWSRLTDEQRADWLATFRALTIHTYASRFERFSGQVFEVGDVAPASRGTSVVHTRILSPGKEPAEIRYRMRPLGEKDWRIVDVYLDGTVSELALRRSEYASVIEREGFEYLTRSLRGKFEAEEPD